MKRHDLFRIGSACWPVVVGTGSVPLPPASLRLLRRWGEEGWPVIARRPGAYDAAGGTPVGVPLPPAFGKARVALRVPPDIPLEAVPALPLALARAAMPATWQATAASLQALGDRVGAVPTVFGAVLWQSMTGLAYVGPQSDLDLLWCVSDPATVSMLLTGLRRIEAAAPMRLDGEVRLAAGDIHWRELADAGLGGTVLAKGGSRTAMLLQDVTAADA